MNSERSDHVSNSINSLFKKRVREIDLINHSFSMRFDGLDCFIVVSDNDVIANLRNEGVAT